MHSGNNVSISTVYIKAILPQWPIWLAMDTFIFIATGEGPITWQDLFNPWLSTPSWRLVLIFDWTQSTFIFTMKNKGGNAVPPQRLWIIPKIKLWIWSHVDRGYKGAGAPPERAAFELLTKPQRFKHCTVVACRCPFFRCFDFPELLHYCQHQHIQRQMLNVIA